MLKWTVGCLMLVVGNGVQGAQVLRGSQADACDAAYTDLKSCLSASDMKCLWCVSAATPEPHCLTPDTASLLPPDVWKCNGAAQTEEEEEQEVLKAKFDVHCYNMNPTTKEACVADDTCSWCIPHEEIKDEVDEMCAPDWAAKIGAKTGYFDCTGVNSETLTSPASPQASTEEFLKEVSLSSLSSEDTHCITDYTTEDACFSDADRTCSWCTVKEQYANTFLKDICFPTDYTDNKLIQMVYDCEAPTHAYYNYDDDDDYFSRTSTDEETMKQVEEMQDQQEETTNNNQFRYNFIPDVTHVLQDDVVDPQFCDPDTPKSLSGYMSVEGSKYDQNGEDKHYFFWMSESRTHSDATTPFLVWLTGGPGCSSSFALLYENGPCSVNADGDGTVPNPYSWNNKSHILYLDQPTGVGFSYGKETDRNENMVGENAYFFLQAFMKAHPEYSHNPIYIVGESYGGHYAPSIAHRIHVGNQEKLDGTMQLNLQGLAVGNGLTNPEVQYEYYADMAYKNSHGIKVVSEQVYQKMKDAGPTCSKLAHKCNDHNAEINPGPVESLECQTAVMYCNMALMMPYQMTGLNPYDIRKPCEHPPLCYDTSNVENFMNLDSTRQALHVSDKSSSKWSSCNMIVHTHFNVDWMKNIAPMVTDLLNDGIRVLIYAGDVDFICNYLGNRAWTLDLEWEHKDDFNAAEEHEWNNKSGLARTSSGFTFLQVYDAGHMVPMDKPEVALDMINQFTAGKDF